MNLLHAVILGIVEGLTEYLPVSSTGHLILTGHLLGLHSAPALEKAADSFEIIIQSGAVLAVLIHYRALLAERAAGVLRREPAALRLVLSLLVAFLPLAVTGLVFGKAIKAVLFKPVPIAIALIVGGVVMIVFERQKKRSGASGLDGLEHLTVGRALAIGVGQCMALWPGMSRSMSTILAGELAGLSTRTAAEFSFLLALPTLGAATLYELVKSRHELMASTSFGVIAAGLAVSFVVAWAVIAAFLRYLNRYGLAPFGAYRIVVGGIVFAVLAR